MQAPLSAVILATGFQDRKPSDRRGLPRLRLYHYETRVAEWYNQKATGESRPKVPTSTRLSLMETLVRFPVCLLCSLPRIKPQKSPRLARIPRFSSVRRFCLFEPAPRLSASSLSPAPSRRFANSMGTEGTKATAVPNEATHASGVAIPLCAVLPAANAAPVARPRASGNGDPRHLWRGLPSDARRYQPGCVPRRPELVARRHR
jgi:hypothetical protein